MGPGNAHRVGVLADQRVETFAPGRSELLGVPGPEQRPDLILGEPHRRGYDGSRQGAAAGFVNADEDGFSAGDAIGIVELGEREGRKASKPTGDQAPLVIGWTAVSLAGALGGAAGTTWSETAGETPSGALGEELFSALSSAPILAALPFRPRR